MEGGRKQDRRGCGSRATVLKTKRFVQLLDGGTSYRRMEAGVQDCRQVVLTPELPKKILIGPRIGNAAKRCSACFSWRLSRKKARTSTGMMMATAAGDDDGIGVGAEIMKQEHDTGNTPPAMSLDQLDALVTHEIQRHVKVVRMSMELLSWMAMRWDRIKWQ
eukprot:scaffold24280_cov55-Cyclotella_meneghiniana.AAC.2